MDRHNPTNRDVARNILQDRQETAGKSYQELLSRLANIPNSAETLREVLETQVAPNCSSVFSHIAALRDNMTSCKDIAASLKDQTAPDHRNFPEIRALPQGSSLITRRGTVHDHLMSRPSIIDGRRLITEDGLGVVSSLNAAYHPHYSLATDLQRDFSHMAEALGRHIRQAGDSSAQLSEQQTSELLDTLTQIGRDTKRHVLRIKAARTCPLPPL